MMDKFKKRLILLGTFALLILLSIALNITFSMFTKRSERAVANIKVAGMEYSMHINGNPGFVITALNNEITKANISITALNKIDSKYELIYDICSDQNCTDFIEKPNDLIIEYSSRTNDTVIGMITSNGNKNIRIIITNDTDQTYYIKMKINAGYIHNTLELENQIATEYNEEDMKIAAIIDGEISTTFPATNFYDATVICTVNGGPSNATGTVTWDETKWVVNITGVDTGQTSCNAVFTGIPWFNSPSGTLLYALRTTNNVVNPVTSPGKAISTAEEAVLASAEDDYGTSYYFRGAVTNNYILYANMCWRIVRVTGDGSIKLVLYNYNTGASSCSGTGTSYAFARYSGTTYTTKFNEAYNSNAYVGFMYGTPGSETYAAEHANTNKSTILTNLETWYSGNLATYESQLADTIWCNDKSVDTAYPYGTILGYGSNQTGYSAYGRIYADGTSATNAAPTLRCPDDTNGGKLSKFTVDDTTYGNGALTHKIGLLTVDEVAYAGATYVTANSTYYLNQNTSDAWWSLSPYGLLSIGIASVWLVNSPAGLSGADSVDFDYNLRPAVSLKSTTIVTGSGTSVDPYVVS